ncbi:voltage-dependent calcium channel subunit alpha-2/delta-4-like [Centruroides sculpturatus]|uniref:voltage-dependent calcium channel subunit alpha-2/delta-4-like n=1 Tax=Centruroides sculpturatus TaxID=218467 RepID=UPI000C6D75D2|nr:voltage-dependent calcium channel subunit alpha-2/delta-4-like [Centruroides sculpturatus]
MSREVESRPGARRPTRLFRTLLWATLTAVVAPSPVDDVDDYQTVVENWALKFGSDIFDGSAKAVSLRKLREQFTGMNPKVSPIVTDEMFKEMRTSIQNMLNWKLRIVEKAADAAEAEALKHDPDKPVKFKYYNAKKIRDPREKISKEEEEEEEEEEEDDDEESEEKYQFLELERKRTFDWPINLTYSSIHVPTNVYHKAPAIVDGIKWSDAITSTFKNNLAVDPFLSWQYFGSSTGFLRIYPAMQWRNGEKTDMYDCRMRRWFIQAAASPKDVVVLLDGSGSMLGLRKEIARNVVLTILDTLTENDYFTVIRFSDVIQYMVPCTEDTLVQATDFNIREFKEHLKNPETVNIANFSLALITAFELLQKYNRSGEGSQCNQAIMLITDGAPYTYKEIFERYNHPNIPVRVFTYLIGREVTDIREVNFMACDNRGYYTHVTTLAEVREQVQKYIPVMSRPIVLSGVRTTIWTSVYADISVSLPLSIVL